MKPVLFFLLFCSACTQLDPKVAKAAAEGAYTAALLRCVDQAETLERSQACRKSVDEQYGVKR